MIPGKEGSFCQKSHLEISNNQVDSIWKRLKRLSKSAKTQLQKITFLKPAILLLLFSFFSDHSHSENIHMCSSLISVHGNNLKRKSYFVATLHMYADAADDSDKALHMYYVSGKIWGPRMLNIQMHVRQMSWPYLLIIFLFIEFPSSFLPFHLPRSKPKKNVER